jgi:uncharacterized repeat protein (TIGR02543 family)
MKKKMLAGLMAILMAVCFAACDGTPPEATDPAGGRENMCTVTFDSAGGTAVDSQRVEKGKTVTEPTGPTKPRYAFAGWYYDREDEYGATYTELWDFDAVVNADLTLTAHWTQTQFLVSFVTNVEGEELEGQALEPGDKAEEPEALTKAGHTFVGWYTGSAFVQKWDFDSQVTQDRVLYARWLKNKTVDGDLSDWSQEETENYIVVRGAANETRGGTLYAKHVRDYGLFLSGYFDHNTNPTGGTSTDWWRRPNVEFHVNGHGTNLYINRDDQTNLPGRNADSPVPSAGKLVTLARADEGNEGFPNNFRSYFEIFINHGNIPNRVDDGAQRVGLCFMASHLSNSVALAGSVSESAALGSRGGDALWCRNGLAPGDKGSGYYIFEDITARGIYDNANRNPIVNTVMFDTNGGTAVLPQEATLGGKLTAPVTTRSGYNFDGWYKSGDFTISPPSSENVTTGGTGGNYTAAEWDFDSDVVWEGYTLYAKWAPAATGDYTVIFDANGADDGDPADITAATIGELVTAPAAPTKAGYIFIDWYASSTFEGSPWRFAGDRIPYSADKTLTLYALWLEREAHTVTFDTDGGSTIADASVEAGELVTRPGYPTKAGNVFAGWYKDTERTEAWNFKTDKVLSPTTIYAKWAVSALADVTGEIMGIRDERGTGQGLDIAAWIVDDGGADGSQAGIQIRYAIYHNNAVVTNAGAWHTNTNAEFWIGGTQRFYTLGSQSNNLNNGTGTHSTVAGSTVPGITTAYITTVELFIPNDVAITGNLRMQFAAKPDGGAEKMKIVGFTEGDGLDAWWMVSTPTVRAFRGEGNTFRTLGDADNRRFFVYSDGLYLTEK